jgi:hypothetical protein
MAGAPPQANFYLWGAWKQKAIKEPFLTKKVPGQCKKVVLGESFVVTLTEKGTIYSWGKDNKDGCLGLGKDKNDQFITNRDMPNQVMAPGLEDVMDIQMGVNHLVALTKEGCVFTWGNGSKGKLGLGKENMGDDTEGQLNKFEPKKVTGLLDEKIRQIAVVRDSTFALTSSGVVYGWGGNEDNVLGLEDVDSKQDYWDQPKALKLLGDMQVRKLEVFEGRTIIAHVRSQDPEDPRGLEPLEDADGDEVDIFKGIDEMRHAMEKTQEWWNLLLNIKHGQPYDMPHDTAASDGRPQQPGIRRPGSIEDDMEVEFDKLCRAERHLDALVNLAKMELKRTQQIPGTRNVRFILCMFIDECRLRCEKVRRTISARQLMDAKKRSDDISARTVTDFGSDANEEIRKIIAVTKELQQMLDQVKRISPEDPMTIHLKVTLIECLECKLQLHDTRVELLKAAEGKPTDPMLPALRIIKDRWNSLKHFSLYALYLECETKRLDFGGNDDEHLAYLVNASNFQIDQILQIDKDQIISHDTLVPALCYDLLRENAELRKMANSYQLHVLMLYQGKNVSGSNVGMVGGDDEEEGSGSEDAEGD